MMTFPLAPTIGLIVPPASGVVPKDATLLYGERAHFIARGLGVGSISPTGFNLIMNAVVDKACELRDAGAQVISLMGTSISFYRGTAFSEDLCAAMQEATGLPCTTMSHAIVSALRALSVQRVAVVTSYIDELNQNLVNYLTDKGFEVTAIEGLSITGIEEVSNVAPQILFNLAEFVYQQDPSADGILISCGGLSTLDVIKLLEAKLGLSATASSPAGFWDVVRLSGLTPSVAGYGRLFDLNLS